MHEQRLTKPHAVRWARRKVKNEMDYTRWHWTTDARFTICGTPIPVGLKGTLLPELCEQSDVVDCKRCEGWLGHEQEQAGSEVPEPVAGTQED